MAQDGKAAEGFAQIDEKGRQNAEGGRRNIKLRENLQPDKRRDVQEQAPPHIALGGAQTRERFRFRIRGCREGKKR